MIRIVVMMDRAGILRAHDDVAELTAGQASSELGDIIDRVYASGTVAADEAAWNAPTRRARHRRYVVTADREFDSGDEMIRVCFDPTELIERFATSNDELVVVGGKTMFDTFTPAATHLDLIVAHASLAPGPIYDAWDNGDFKVADQEEHRDFDLVSYRRKHPVSLDSWFAD